MREKEAKVCCPDLICVKVPSKNGKADLTKYRDAGLSVAKVLQTFTPLLERASVDEGKYEFVIVIIIDFFTLHFMF
jgi:DNA polymerase eta